MILSSSITFQSLSILSFVQSFILVQGGSFTEPETHALARLSGTSAPKICLSLFSTLGLQAYKVMAGFTQVLGIKDQLLLFSQPVLSSPGAKVSLCALCELIVFTPTLPLCSGPQSHCDLALLCFCSQGSEHLGSCFLGLQRQLLLSQLILLSVCPSVGTDELCHCFSGNSLLFWISTAFGL